jgi:hypothetical protein
MTEHDSWLSQSPAQPPNSPPTAPAGPTTVASPGWNRARIERNRILLLLSGGGIGLLLILLATTGPSGEGELLVEVSACAAFFVALLTGLVGFERSARVHPEARRHDALVGRIDSIMLVAFLIGVALCVLVALSSGLSFLRNADDQADSTGRYETSAVPCVNPADAA